MGYTHYWDRPQTMDADRFTRFARDVAQLAQALPETATFDMHNSGPSGEDYRSSQWDTYLFRTVIKGSLGEGAPEYTAELVAFNGDERARGMYTGETKKYGDMAETYPAIQHRVADMSHESFYIPRVKELSEWDEPHANGNYFDCCKTARKPYDLLVMVALIALRQNFPECAVSSDGDPEDWAPAVKLYEQVFPDRPLPFKGPWQRVERASDAPEGDESQAS